MRVKDIMHSVIRLPQSMSVAEIAYEMAQKPTGSVLIEDDGKVTGIITERDILQKVVAKKKNPANVRAFEIANFPIITIDANRPVEEASDIMQQNRIRRIVVTEGGRIVGKLTAGAIAKNVRYMRAESLLNSDR